jgi:hypothetical protein
VRRLNLGDLLIGGAGVGMIMLWVVSVITSLAVPIVVVWGVIKLVKHFTAS